MLSFYHLYSVLQKTPALSFIVTLLKRPGLLHGVHYLLQVKTEVLTLILEVCTVPQEYRSAYCDSLTDFLLS